MLGVCLGHQCIGHVFGGEVVRNYRIMHGKTSPIHHDGQGVFRGLSNPFEATRYHSLVIRRETFQQSRFRRQRLDRGRRDHGRAAPHLAAARRAVSSGELSDGRRAAVAAEFSGHTRIIGSGVIERLNFKGNRSPPGGKLAKRGPARRRPTRQRLAFPASPVRFTLPTQPGKRTCLPEVPCRQGLGEVRFRTPRTPPGAPGASNNV